jgi:hypothetical protein
MCANKNNSHGRGGRGSRNALRPYLPVLLALILLIPFQTASAAVQLVSGQTQTLGNNVAHGTTSYVVDYTYPATAQVGTNFNISLTLRVGQFGGLIEYITAYELEVQLFVGAQQLETQINGPIAFNSSSYLYPGGIWGPNNATFALTEADTGLATGESANATFSITLQDSAAIGVPYNIYETEPAMQGLGGSLVIQNDVASSTTSTSTTAASSAQTILPYALLASGAVLIAAAVFLPRGPRSPAPNQK